MSTSEEAKTPALTHDKAKQIALAGDDCKKSAFQHLEVLSEKMAGVSKECNQFANRFLFGGIVAVVALLNTDLVVEKKLAAGGYSPWAVWVLCVGVLCISGVYFYVVDRRIRRMQDAYRSTKHKYELTLYALCLGGSAEDLAAHLEKETKIDAANPTFNPAAGFVRAAEYLHHHHAQSAEKIKKYRDWLMAMLIVGLAVFVKLVIYFGSSAATNG